MAITSWAREEDGGKTKSVRKQLLGWAVFGGSNGEFGYFDDWVTIG